MWQDKITLRILLKTTSAKHIMEFDVILTVHRR